MNFALRDMKLAPLEVYRVGQKKSDHFSFCWKAEVLLFETIGQRNDVMKSKKAARGKFKSRNLFLLLLLLNVTFPLSSKIDNLGIIWSTLRSTRASSRGSL